MTGCIIEKNISYPEAVCFFPENNHPAFPFHPRPVKKKAVDIKPKRKNISLPNRNFPIEEPGKAAFFKQQFLPLLNTPKPNIPPERPDPEKTPKPNIPDQPDKPLPPERPDKPYQPDQPSRPDQPMHPNKPSTPNQPVALS
jgi:hypothetical protein